MSRRAVAVLALAAACNLSACSASPSDSPAPAAWASAAAPASTTPKGTGIPTGSGQTADPSTSGHPRTDQPSGSPAGAMPSLPVTGTCPTARAGSIKVAPGTGKTVALTFDDGPGPDDQPIVDILARYHVRATFFLTGAHAAARPQNVQVISRAGHLVAGHSYNHQYPNAVPGGWTAAYLHQQLTDSDSLLSRLTGQPVCFFRPPGGFLTGVAEAAAAANLSVAMWSVDSEDWKQPGQVSAAATAAIVAAATAAAGQAHPIVLMHTGKASHEPDSTVSSFRGNTVAALPAVIEWYQGHGYRFVGMDGKS